MKTKPKMITRVWKRENVKAAVKALRKTRLFDVETDFTRNTVIVTHIESDREVFRGLGKDKEYWIVRMDSKLFM